MIDYEMFTIKVLIEKSLDYKINMYLNFLNKFILFNSNMMI